MKNYGKLLIALVLAISFMITAYPARSLAAEPKIKVLTFNIWGIIGAKKRPVRMKAIGEKIAALDPDIIAIEEAFEAKHRKILMKSLKDSGYKFEDYRYYKNVYGSGCLLISKYPITESYFEPYRVIGGVWDIEWLGGKGLAYLNLDTPWGPLDFFLTHAIARMSIAFDSQGNYMPGDPKQVDRLLHMYQIDHFIRTHKNPRARSIIAAGDFNVCPEMLEYQFLIKKTGLESSFEILNPGENPSTFSPVNVWVEEEYGRIDHILFKNYNGTEGFWLRPTVSRVEMNETFTNMKSGNEINYSDHYGLWTEFEVITGSPEAPSPVGILAQCPACMSDLSGYADGKLELDSANALAWRNTALGIFAKAYDEEDRHNKLLIPLAEIITYSDETPRTIKFEGGTDAQIESIIGVGEEGEK